jgi:hypothetical protein
VQSGPQIAKILGVKIERLSVKSKVKLRMLDIEFIFDLNGNSLLFGQHPQSTFGKISTPEN